MTRKLMILMLTSVILSGVFGSAAATATFDRPRPQEIPVGQIVPSSLEPLAGDKALCLIQSDNDNETYFFAGFQPGDGIALYMDPGKCGVQDPYPFRITDVRFSLYDHGGYTWPVEVQVSIRDLIGGDKCNGPGNLLCSQVNTYPSDSGYPNLIQLDLDPFCCVQGPFFLEITYTGGTNPTYPSLMMTDTLDQPDTCEAFAWYFWEGQHWYFEWSDFWFPPPTGYPIMRVSGYTEIAECEPCWYWKPDHPDQNPPASSGMPDFGQYQFGDSTALCGPAAVANCLWWFGAVPPEMDAPSFIRLLSDYFTTDPTTGTYVDSIQQGLDRYFEDYGFPLYQHAYFMPEFDEMEESLEVSQDIILLLGFWQRDPGTQDWYRLGGHFVTMSGVCSDSIWVAFSDPARDMAEYGSPGRARPLQHPTHTPGDTLHNDPKYVSHDVYDAALQSESPGGLWWLPDYHLFLDPADFEGQNFQPEHEGFFNPYLPAEPVYAEIEFAIMICPSDWYWKPERPNQDHPAPSGMPDFDQRQDAWAAYCGPTAVANCLWWFDAVPTGWTPPQLIDTLARYLETNPDFGTDVYVMQTGLEQYFQDHAFSFKESTFVQPNFYEMEESLEVSQDIILLLGFYWSPNGLDWNRDGGHFVTMAGVSSESLRIAISDPDWDGAVLGARGRVRPPDHPPSGQYDATLHNNPSFVSHDIYDSDLTPEHPSPGNPFWEINYPYTGKYSGMNVPERFKGVSKPAPKDAQFYATEVEFAVMICPKPTAVEDEGEESGMVPESFELYQSYPNPFNSQTVIKYDLLKSCQVTLSIYNILGQKVRTLVSELQEPGPKSLNWNGKDEKGRDLASGIYFYQLKAGEVTRTRRMVLLK